MLWKKQAKRGYYSEDKLEFTIAYDGEARLSTTLHEFAHRVEHTFGSGLGQFAEVLDLEEQFYMSRTPGEPLRWLGEPYGKDELARFDKFSDRYMGKEYLYQGEMYSFEILTMGLEGVFFNKFDLQWGDPEMFRLILGILASKGKFK